MILEAIINKTDRIKLIAIYFLYGFLFGFFNSFSPFRNTVHKRSYHSVAEISLNLYLPQPSPQYGHSQWPPRKSAVLPQEGQRIVLRGAELALFSWPDRYSDERMAAMSKKVFRSVPQQACIHPHGQADTGNRGCIPNYSVPDSGYNKRSLPHGH